MILILMRTVSALRRHDPVLGIASADKSLVNAMEKAIKLRNLRLWPTSNLLVPSYNRPFTLGRVPKGHEIESETEHSIDLGSFLMSQFTAGHEIESEVRVGKK